MEYKDDCKWSTRLWEPERIHIEWILKKNQNGHYQNNQNAKNEDPAPNTEPCMCCKSVNMIMKWDNVFSR